MVGWPHDRPRLRRRPRDPPGPRAGDGARRAVHLSGTPGTELYAAAHVPGAPHLDLDAALAGPPGVRGRHPLPDPAVLQAALRACGVGDEDEVVVYDQATSLASARAWWVLRWAGHPAVRVLDGGLEAWRRAGQPVTTEVPTRRRARSRCGPARCPCSTPTRRPRWRAAACSSTCAPPSATAASASRSTAWRGTCRARSTCRWPTCSPPTARSCRPTRARAGRRGRGAPRHPRGHVVRVGGHRGADGAGAAHRRHRLHPVRRVVERVDRGPEPTRRDRPD